VDADLKLKGAPEHAGDGRKLGQVKRLERENLAKSDGRAGALERGGSATPRSKAPAEQTAPAPSPRTQAEPPADGSETLVVPEAAPAPKSNAPSKLTPSP
jgi:hypothetical protein